MLYLPIKIKHRGHNQRRYITYKTLWPSKTNLEKWVRIKSNCVKFSYVKPKLMIDRLTHITIKSTKTH